MRDLRFRRRSRYVRLGLAHALVSTLLLSIPAAATPVFGTLKPPVLWSGRIVDPRGAPARAIVHIAVRPPATIIPRLGGFNAPSSSALAATPSFPLASGVTDADGHFELRSVLPPVPPTYTPGGWINLILFAEAQNGSWSVATDSVRYVARDGGTGLWVSKLSSEERVRQLAALDGLRGPDLAALLGQDLVDERPEVITLERPLSLEENRQRLGQVPAGYSPPGSPYAGCTARYVEDSQAGFRTIADIDIGRDWSYRIDYQETDTTSWDVGYEGSGRGWKAGGTASFSQRSSGGFNADLGPSVDDLYRESYQVELEHAKVLWQCGTTGSPGPVFVRTVEPTRWTGGTFNQGDPEVMCRSEFQRYVATNTYAWREKGSSSRWSASGNLWGFSGQASVEYLDGVRLGWVNHQPQPRFVCGESGDPYVSRTRVEALNDGSGAPA